MVLQQNTSHTSHFLQNIEITDDITLPTEPSREHLQMSTTHASVPIIKDDSKHLYHTIIENPENVISNDSTDIVSTCSARAPNALAYHQLQGTDTKS